MSILRTVADAVTGAARFVAGALTGSLAISEVTPRAERIAVRHLVDGRAPVVQTSPGSKRHSFVMDVPGKGAVTVRFSSRVPYDRRVLHLRRVVEHLLSLPTEKEIEAEVAAERTAGTVIA